MNGLEGILFVCQLFLLCGLCSAAPPTTLKQVNVLYRHGDRSPTNVYPKDKHQVPDAWPDGLGWLSNIGKMQQYELGQFIRAHYDGFINTSYYKHDEILIQSSGIERCLMSAYSNLAGLYPPGEVQTWNKDIPWQPIPVQSSPEATDNKLSENAPCPKYDELHKQVLNSDAIKKEEKENKAFYDMVVENTGIKKESVEDIWQVADTLICERAHNLTWNDWAYKPGVWEKLNELRTLSFDLLYAKPEMCRLKGGPLLKEMIANMKSAKEGSEDVRKFYMYSAHDTTVASLLSAMLAWDKHQPIYRALVMVELHTLGQDYEVKIFYRNDTSRDPYPLSAAGCGSPCTLDKFIEITTPYVPDDWDAECKAVSSLASSNSLSPASWIALTAAVSLTVVLIVSLVIAVIRLRKKKEALYSRLS